MFIKQREDGVTIKVKVTPNAGRDSISVDNADCLHVKLTSSPVEGKANRSLLKFLGKKLGVAPSSITILFGHSSREKVILIAGADEATVRQKISPETKTKEFSPQSSQRRQREK